MTETGPDFPHRLLHVLLCKGEPDRVPLVEAGIDNRIKERFLGRAINAPLDEAEFWARAGYDFVPLGAGLRTVIDAAIHQESTGRFEGKFADNVPIARAKRFAMERLLPQHLATSDADGKRRTWAAEGKGFITSHEDFTEFPWPQASDFDFADLRAFRDVLPPKMGILCFAGAVLSSVMLMMGFEECFLAAASESDLFVSLVQRVGELQVDVVKSVLDQRLADGIWINDDMGHKTGTLFNPRLYRKLIFPYYREIKQLTGQRDVPLLLHSDGCITGILPDLVDIGFNGIHPIEPSCMDIAESRRIVGPDVCLMGNLSLSYPLGTGNPSQVAQETRDLIRKMAPGGGYCLSSGNSIPDYIPYENWNAMRLTGLQYGVYPISDEDTQ